jgi:hypothetical protein
LVAAPIQEKGDVGEFFSLSKAQLAQFGAADGLTERILDSGGSKSHREVLELFVVKRQDYKIEVLKICR